MDLIFATLIGTLAGAFVGLLPGFGMSSLLLLAAPILIQQSFLFCVVFYCCASSAAQYFGSVTTIGLRIPGESTSLPLLEVLKKTNRLNDLYFVTAFGSLVGAFIAGVIIVVVSMYIMSFSFYLKTIVLFWFCVVGIVFAVISGGNHPLVSAMLLVFGWLISKIGYDGVHQVDFLTFGNQYLYGGIPILPIILGVYCIPGVFSMFREINRISHKLDIASCPKLILLNRHYKTMIASSFFGFVAGLIPYVGSGISSTLAYMICKKYDNDPIDNAVASETANNSASLSVLIPFLFLGIAIVPSEFLLLEILPYGNIAFSGAQIVQSFAAIAICVFVSNIISFFISWKSANTLNQIIAQSGKTIPAIVGLTAIASVLYIGSEYNQGLYYGIVLIVFSVFGLALRELNCLPFVYGLLLQNSFEGTIYKIMQIYF